MRYPASGKPGSSAWSRLGIRRRCASWRSSASRVPLSTAGMIVIARGGIEALADHRSRPDRVWNWIPETIRAEIVEPALRETELGPRELAARVTDEKRWFVPEASV